MSGRYDSDAMSFNKAQNSFRLRRSDRTGGPDPATVLSSCAAACYPRTLLNNVEVAGSERTRWRTGLACLMPWPTGRSDSPRDRNSSARRKELQAVQPLRQLDGGAPRVGQRCRRDAVRALRVGPVKLDAASFELLAERLEAS